MRRSFNKRQVIRILNKNGWEYHHATGSHLIYRNSKNQHIAIPLVHLNEMVMQRIFREYNIDINV